MCFEMKILDPNQSYTFSKIFDLKAEIDEIVAEFGYTLRVAKLNRPQFSGELHRLAELLEGMYRRDFAVCDFE